MPSSKSKSKIFRNFLNVYFRDYSLLGRIFTRQPIQLSDLSDNYDDYWAKRSKDVVRFRFSLKMSFWEKLISQRYRKSIVVTNLIEDGSSIMDVGCGEGIVLEFITKRKKIRKAIGVDLSSDAIKQLKKRGFSGFVGDITDPRQVKKIPKVDYILLLDIIEHLPKPEKLLFLLKDKFRKGILINIPNAAFYSERLRLMFGKVTKSGLFFPGEHIRFWSIPEFKRTCRILGFKVKKSKSVGGTMILRHLYPNLFSASQVFFLRK